ncbi:MAG TPA: ABC transporter C-terminal domain-containing protein [Cellvibrio sp.]|nr:ABC transporter C-terminal domain-containing protein [Cellvibrio sp.]
MINYLTHVISLHTQFIIHTLIVTSLILSGCQSKLETTPDGEGRYTDTEQRARVGIEYSLPMLQFKLSITRTLIQCENENKEIDIRFLAKVTAQPSYVAGERYVVDYEELSSWSKISKFELETYDNGVLKSVNADVEDQSAAIIGDLVKTGISLASLSSGIPSGISMKNLTPQESLGCKQATKELVAHIKLQEADLKDKTKKLVSLTDEIGRMELLAATNAMSETMKDKLGTLKKEMEEAAKQVKDADETLESLITRVSVYEEKIWPTRFDEYNFNATPSPINEKKLLALFNYKEKTEITEQSLKEAYAVNGKIIAVNDGRPQTIDDSLQVNKKDVSGLFYRNPIPARLLICQATLKDLKSCDINAASAVIINDQVMAPQLGQLRNLPFKNGIFQNNLLTASFRENGSIAKFNYDNKSARGKVLSETVVSGLDNLLKYDDAKKSFKEEQEQKELDKLDNEIAKLEKQKTINSLKQEAALNNNLEDTSAETARLNAHIALLEAKRKSREAQKALDEMDEEE